MIHKRPQLFFTTRAKAIAFLTAHPGHHPVFVGNAQGVAEVWRYDPIIGAPVIDSPLDTLAKVFGLPATPDMCVKLVGADGLVGSWRYSSTFSAWVPEGRINVRAVNSDVIAGYFTDREGGGSAFTWNGGALVTDATRFAIQWWSSAIAREDCLDVTVEAVWEDITLTGSLGASSRPRWVAGVSGANRLMSAGPGYNGSAWHGGANEYGPLAAPNYQSAVVLPGFATGTKVVSRMSLTPRTTDTNSAYVLGSATGAASGEAATWDGTAAESIIADPDYLLAELACRDTHSSTTPGGLLTELWVSFKERRA